MPIPNLGELAEKAGQAATRGLENTSIGRGVLNLAGNHEWELELNPEGQAVKSMLGRFEEIRAASINQSNKNQQKLWDHIQSDPQIRAAHDPKTATIQDYHDYATKQGHPIARTTQAILDDHLDPNTGISRAADKTMETLSYQNKAKAKLDGVAGSFGPKYENLSPLLARLAENPDPRVNMNGSRILDIVSNYLRDTSENLHGQKGAPYSTVKEQVGKAFGIYNKFAEKNLAIPDVAPTYFKPSNAEYMYKDILRTIQLPAIILPHLSQYAHLAATAPLQALTKQLFTGTSKEAERIIDSSAVMSNTAWDILHSDILSKTGKIATWTKSPTAGSILNKTFHQPGFSWMRKHQLATTASLGFHSAIHWAAEAVKGDKRAALELKEMGINISDVVNQKGKLNEEQLTKAVFHFTNNRMFFAKSIDQSMYANRNFLTRSMFMYHSFLNSETAFLRRELIKMSKAGDVKGIARFVGVLGLAFPAAAPLLKSAEIFARTGSPSQAGQSAKENYSALTGQEGAGAFAMSYIDMISLIGGIGVFRNYLNSVKGHMLLNTVVGPMLGTPVSHLQDVGSAAYQSGKKEDISEGNWKQVGRDILSDVPVVGRPLSHQVFPTAAEQKEE